ncbi:hypothetical protein QL285_011657 [Trifolium repens]|nr:hypothetical protein QL285_011657 [Trifolium repens]
MSMVASHLHHYLNGWKRSPLLKVCTSVAFLPPNLCAFHVDSVRITKPVTEWGLQGLTSLSSMKIRGDDIVNMFLKELKMPISLVSLTIQYVSETKSLEGNGLGHLSSLKELCVSEFLELVSLPEKSLPSSLKSLYFYDCPRLVIARRRPAFFS